MWSPLTGQGTLFADIERLALWLELLDRCNKEVIQVGAHPARWLALPIDASTDDIMHRYNTDQGWRTPEEAAYVELAFAPPRRPPADEELSEWYWRDATCTTTTHRSGPRQRTTSARKTSRESFFA